MNKEDLINLVASADGFTKKQARVAVERVLNAIKEGLKKDGIVRIIGFGTFKISERKERKGRNPQTGEEIVIPAKKVIKFSPGKELNEVVE